MSTQTSAIPVASTRPVRLLRFGSAALTYGVGLWIVMCNPFVASQINHLPIIVGNSSVPAYLLLGTLVLTVGRTPFDCLVRVTVIAIIVQALSAFLVDDDQIDMDTYRPYVFWRAIIRFLGACLPFLSGRRLDAPPTTSLTQYERITIRYFFVKLIFMPMMIGFFFGNFQSLVDNIELPWGPSDCLSPFFLRHLYVTVFIFLMEIDIAWFAIGCSIETGKYSPIKMVDPYASGWLVALLCYPPLVSLSGQIAIWPTPEFPALSTPGASLVFAGIGLSLFTFYVVSDMCFGLKTGNLTYRGLVHIGPYRLIRHPMYASKTLAWCIFTLPMLNIGWRTLTIPLGWTHLGVPFLTANWSIVWAMAAWVGVYATRAITEERYLLAFPEYREYCKRVRHRFIPGVI